MKGRGSLTIRVLLLLLCMGGMAHGAERGTRYPTGLLPATEADKAWAKSHMRRIRSRADLSAGAYSAQEALPARVINVDYLPNVGLQLYGSCTSWAIVYYYKTWQEAREHGWKHPNTGINPERVMSPAFIYNLANGGNPHAGSAVIANFEYLRDYGACSCAEMEPNADPRAWPTENQYLAAFPQRAQSFAYIETHSTDGFNALKAHLASGDLACFSMNIYNNFHAYPATAGASNEVYYANVGDLYFAPGATSAGHEMCIIGYDDNKAWTDGQGANHTGAVLVVNSWGTEWGAHLPEAGSRGFLWLSYDYFQAVANDTAIMEDRIGYQPTLVGAYHITHGRAAEVNVDLLGGDRDSPNWTMHVMPRTGGLRPIDATVAFDATEYASTNNLSWWLQISDVNLSQPMFQPNMTGEVTSFKIRTREGKVWQSPDTPVQTVESNIVNAYAWANIGMLQKKRDLFDQNHPAISESVWGDLDGDGDMDLFFVDSTAGSPWTYAARLYRNDGNWSFTEVDGGLPAQQGGMALGDYDGDTLPDLVLNGWDAVLDKTWTRLYHNNGQCQFSDSGTSLPNSMGKMDWIDFNNDGKLDLALATADDYWQATGVRIFLNKGTGIFSDSGIRLPQSKIRAWGDYNRDGRIDLAQTDDSGYIQIYRNTGSALSPVSPPIYFYAYNLSWGDLDSDGWLDLAFTGYDLDFKRAAHIYRNTNGALAPHATFPCALGGGIAWGDIDNDGRADLCVWGDLGAYLPGSDQNIATRIYRNAGNGVLQNLGFNLWGAGSTMSGPLDFVRMLDLDTDGDLDLAVCGPGSIPYPQPRALRIYENVAAQAGGLDKPNKPPLAPTGLRAQTNSSGKIELRWNASSDAETSGSGLAYRLRAGNNPGWENIISSNAETPSIGVRLRPQLASGQSGFTFPAPTKPFFWSVQAIDAGLRGSEWSAPKLFTPSGSSAPGDANEDKSVDIADVIKTIRMATGQETAKPSVADRNSDSRVDLVDAEHVKAMLLGNSGPGTNYVAGKRIGPEGGTVQGGNISLTVPAGAFAQASEVYIQRFTGDNPFKGNGASPLYQIEGLPPEFSGALTLRIKAEKPTTGTTFAAVGEITLSPSAAMESRGFRFLPVKSEANAYYSCPISGTPPKAASPSRAAQTAPGIGVGAGGQYTLTIYTGLVTSYNLWANNRFSIKFPMSVKFTDVTNLASALENAYDKLSDPATFSFNYAGRTSSGWPMNVTVLDMNAAGKYGEFVPSKLGDNYGWIEVNSVNIGQTAEIKTTAVHEFFHMVQKLYDSRTGFVKALSAGEQFWLTEAASVWSEELGANSSYVSSFYDQNSLSPFRGMHAGAKGSKTEIQDHGYGMASLVKYMVKRQGNDFPRKVFESIKSGSHPVDAIAAHSPTPGGFGWWPEYMTALVKGEIYGFDFADMTKAAPAERQMKIEFDTDMRASRFFSGSLPDLSGQLHMVYPLYSGLKDSSVLSHRLKVEEGDQLKLFVLKAKSGEPTQLIGQGVEANGSLKFDVPNLKQIQAQGGWRLLALVTNERAVKPYTQAKSIQLQVAETDEHEVALPSRPISASPYGVGLGSFGFSCSGAFKGKGWSNLQTMDLGLFSFVLLNVPAVTPITYQFQYRAVITNGTMTDPPDSQGYYEVATVSAIKNYRLEFYEDTGDGQPAILNAGDGKFSFEVDRDDQFAGGTVYAVFDILRRRYNPQGGLVSQTTEANMEWPILGLYLEP